MLIDRIVGNTDINFVSYGSRYVAEKRERERKRGSGERKRKSRQIMEIPRKKVIIRLQ